MVSRPAFSSACCLALLIGGCPKRQTGVQIVYIPLPPQEAPAPGAQSSGTLVVEETAPPPASTEAAPELVPAHPPARHPRRTTRTAPDTPEASPEPAAPEPPAETPTLEPRETPQQESQLRRELLARTQQVQQLIARARNAGQFSDNDRRIIEAAQSFLGQSSKALEDGDLPRALTLARKAHLLVSALEQQQ